MRKPRELIDLKGALRRAARPGPGRHWFDLRRSAVESAVGVTAVGGHSLNSRAKVPGQRRGRAKVPKVCMKPPRTVQRCTCETLVPRSSVKSA
jgi:hypothetical protein